MPSPGASRISRAWSGVKASSLSLRERVRVRAGVMAFSPSDSYSGRNDCLAKYHRQQKRENTVSTNSSEEGRPKIPPWLLARSDKCTKKRAESAREVLTELFAAPENKVEITQSGSDERPQCFLLQLDGSSGKDPRVDAVAFQQLLKDNLVRRERGNGGMGGTCYLTENGRHIVEKLDKMCPKDSEGRPWSSRMTKPSP
jgi:hypothetical protein